MLSHLRLFPVSKRLAPSIRWFSNEVIREQGEVLWFNHKRGFGFIAYQNGKNIFVHQSQIASDGFRALLGGINFLNYNLYICF
ncbi:hypothetical protein EON65_16290 [archaeon]|nr:MAG: hypothetical protein EON65_16290 [archaeon]